MNGIWKEFAEKLGVRLDMENRSYWVIDGGDVVIEGHGGVRSVGRSEISFVYGGGLLVVSGSGLTIKNISGGFAVVGGEISGVAVTER